MVSTSPRYLLLFRCGRRGILICLFLFVATAAGQPTDEPPVLEPTVTANPRQALAAGLPAGWRLDRESFAETAGCALVLRDTTRPGREHAVVHILPPDSTEKPGTVEGRGKPFKTILKSANGQVHLWADAGRWSSIETDVARALVGPPLRVRPFSAEVNTTVAARRRATVWPNWLQLYRFSMTQEDFERACRAALARRPIEDIEYVSIDTGSHRDMPLGAMAKIEAMAAERRAGRTQRLIRIFEHEIGTFELQVICGVRYPAGSRGHNAPRFSSLTLRVRDYRQTPDPHWPKLAVSRQTAKKLLAHFVREGFFDRAEDMRGNYRGTAPRSYALQLSVSGPRRSYCFRRELCWDSSMIERLRNLAAVLDGEEARAMAKLLSPLEPYGRAWEKAAEDPKYVEAEAKALHQGLADYFKELRARRSTPRSYATLYKRHDALMPLLIPYLLKSSNEDVRHHALILVRDQYGAPKFVPQVIQVLDGLLEDPDDDPHYTRSVAYEILSERRDVRSVPVLIKGLGDPVVRHLSFADPESGHVEQQVFVNWHGADEALREITRADPVEQDAGPEACQAAWQKWWQENRQQLLMDS
jgi:hypothetical protein